MNEIELTEEEQKELIAESAKDQLINENDENDENTKEYTFEEMVELDDL